MGNTSRGGDQEDNSAPVFPSGGPAGSGNGGGLYNNGILYLTNSTLSGNASYGGNFGGTTSLMSNGGGSAYGGGICHAGTSLVSVHNTLANNTAMGGRDTHLNTNGISGGGALAVLSGSASIQKSILADSASGSNCFGPVLDAGYNLSSDSSCPFTNTGSLNSIVPRLGPLADNGGPTLTCALLPGSAAIDPADAGDTTPVDQRGVPRPQGYGRDIGAFEFTQAQIFKAHAPLPDFDLRFSAVPDQVYILQASSDFKLWNNVRTNRASGAGLLIFRLNNDSPKRFFRTVHP